MPPRAGKIYKDIQKKERKIARKEVAKAKKKIRKNKKWTVAASAFGHTAGYSRQQGFFLKRGTVMGHIDNAVAQAPVSVKPIPVTTSHVFSPYYTRKTVKNGMVVCGLQKIGTIASDGNANANAFVVGGSRTHAIQISPDALGGQMATDARNYGYYFFKKKELICVMNAPSTDNLGVAISESPDPAIETFQTVSYDSIQQTNGMIAFTRKSMTPVTLQMVAKPQYKKFNTELDTGTSVSTRNSVQSVLLGFFSANDSSNTTYGDVLLKYELFLFDRLPDYGFTMTIADKSLAVGILKELEKKEAALRAEFKDDDSFNEAKNKLLRSYQISKRHLASYAGVLPKIGTASNPPLVAIGDQVADVNAARGGDSCTVVNNSLSQNLMSVLGQTVSTTADGSGNRMIGVAVGDSGTNNRLGVDSLGRAVVKIQGSDGNPINLTTGGELKTAVYGTGSDRMAVVSGQIGANVNVTAIGGVAPAVGDTGDSTGTLGVTLIQPQTTENFPTVSQVIQAVNADSVSKLVTSTYGVPATQPVDIVAASGVTALTPLDIVGAVSIVPEDGRAIPIKVTKIRFPSKDGKQVEVSKDELRKHIEGGKDRSEKDWTFIDSVPQKVKASLTQWVYGTTPEPKAGSGPMTATTATK